MIWKENLSKKKNRKQQLEKEIPELQRSVRKETEKIREIEDQKKDAEKKLKRMKKKDGEENNNAELQKNY